MNTKLILVGIGLLMLAGLLYGSYSLGKRNVTVTYQTNPLAAANCPEPTAMIGNDFGATTLKLIEVGGQYRKCRAASLAH